MEAEKDELSDLFSLKSEDSATSSFFDGSTSELTASIVRSGSSSNETNTASDSSDTESTISLDDNFVKSVIGSDRVSMPSIPGQPRAMPTYNRG